MPITKHHSFRPVPDVDSLIITVRGQKVLLDSDLARIYGVPTFRFNEAVKRNQHRFPADFHFRLSSQEWSALQDLRLQNASLPTGRGSNSSQIAMSSARHRGGLKIEDGEWPRGSTALPFETDGWASRPYLCVFCALA